MSRPVVLFVSRRFPPSTGGMETHSKAVHDALCRHATVVAVTLGRSGYAHLAWFLPLALVRATVAILRGVDIVVAGDPLVMAALRPLLAVRRRPTVVFVYGLDLTFPNRLYQRLVATPLSTADRVVAISRATEAVAIAAGITPEQIVVVPAATEMTDAVGPVADADRSLRRRFGLPPGKPVLVTVGRLVRRKGVAWFVDEVLPGLPPDVHYLVAGSGPEHDTIRALIDERGLGDRVHLLGRVSDEDREVLFSGGTVFVMPNIVVPDDMEGFGLVAVEAALRGTVVVAAGVEGICDAVRDGATGFLVPAHDAAAFIDRIAALLGDDQERQRLAEEFSGEALRVYGPEATSDRLWAAISAVGPSAI